MARKFSSKAALLALVLIAGLASGCATTPKSDADNGARPDPLEPANRAFFEFNETLDRALIKPIAKGYVAVTPEGVREVITHFFGNLAYLNVIVNSFLQGKFNQGVSDMGRFLVNSTLGIGGLFDVATGMGLSEHNEDFGQTLAVWGSGQGPYLYLPVRGPDSARDVPGDVMAVLLNPLTYLSGTILFPISALNVINKRANLLDETNIRDEAAVDKYTFTREAFIQQREYLIYDGNPPPSGYEDIFNENSDDQGKLIVK